MWIDEGRSLAGGRGEQIKIPNGKLLKKRKWKKGKPIADYIPYENLTLLFTTL